MDDDFAVRRRQCAHRPVRAEHQPVRAEGVQHRVGVRAQVLDGPGGGVGLGDQAGEFADRVGQGGEGADVGGPGFEGAGGDGRLAQVVEDEGEFGQGGGRLDAGGSWCGQDDQVVDQAGVGDGGQTAAYVRAQQPLRVGLALDLVADALEVLAAGEFAQPGELVGDVRAGEVGPADDSRDQVVLGGEGQELRGLLGHGDRLDEDGAVDSGRAGLGGEVRHGEVAPERRCRSGDPVLVPDGQVPDVVVGVDTVMAAPIRRAGRRRRPRRSSRAPRRAVRPCGPARRR